MSLAGPVEIIIGIDPGLTCTGWGVIKKQGAKLLYIESGRLRTKPSDPMAERLAYLFDHLTAICEKYSVTRGAVEAGYVGTGAMSALKLGQARACAVLAIQQATQQVMDVAPREVKMAVTGSGASSNQQVIYMVGQMLGIEFDRGDEDISDALAIAITATSIRNPKLLAVRA